jgi:hypothetical protein
MRLASCSCGQLQVRLGGKLLGVGVCHCLACQKRTGSAFATLASFSAPFDVVGSATQFVRTGDQGSRFTFSFCPTCGTNLFHQEDGETDSIAVAVGAFADPDFPAPEIATYDIRRHPWVMLAPEILAVERDPA